MTDWNGNMYKFTMNFNNQGGALSNITHLINTYGIPNRYIELGIFEGGTTFWFADTITPHNPALMIHAIDPHVGSNDMSEDFTDIRSNFLYNLDVCKHKNIIYTPKHSKYALMDLIQDNVKAQLIYIDGDHKAAEVLTDLVLAWEVLEVGGVLLCDDTTTWKYKDKNGVSSAQMSPRMAVESFIQCNWHKVDVLWLPDGAQTAIRKLDH